MKENSFILEKQNITGGLAFDHIQSTLVNMLLILNSVLFID